MYVFGFNFSRVVKSVKTCISPKNLKTPADKKLKTKIKTFTDL